MIILSFIGCAYEFGLAPQDPRSLVRAELGEPGKLFAGWCTALGG